MKIFLSYRRDDTGGRAGRLFDLLVARFGARNVFQDVTAVAPGRDFAAQVDAAVTGSDAVLVVVGPSWLGMTDDQGARRIDHPDDFVRREVSMALATGMPVVPVLVDDASFPSAEELPDELAPLRLRQAVILRDVSWHQDVDDLIRRLEGEVPLVVTRRRWPWLIAAGAPRWLALWWSHCSYATAMTANHRTSRHHAEPTTPGRRSSSPAKRPERSPTVWRRSSSKL